MGTTVNGAKTMSFSGLFAGFIFGVIGLFCFRTGKKELNYSLIFTGIGLMGYTYFTSSMLQDWGGGIALCGLAYYLHNNHNLTS